MQAVIKITDYDYNNTGQSMVYYKKAKKKQTQDIFMTLWKTKSIN